MQVQAWQRHRGLFGALFSSLINMINIETNARIISSLRPKHKDLSADQSKVKKLVLDEDRSM